MYQIIWGSGDASYNGLWADDHQVASFRLLAKLGYDHIRMLGWSQKAYARVAQEVTEYLASLPPVQFYQPA